ncbi:hypothetical protein L5515_006600 [Caenorhabditis briggsae]|uniref:Uncharacterized protein n=1 Tax=Caenorhabditis briggsae TaxID=6238 RepID=A0AAE9JL41_CAEBR|nr:hypothetical protein L5515_006600 [Caenorhabditis briggsae]
MFDLISKVSIFTSIQISTMSTTPFKEIYRIRTKDLRIPKLEAICSMLLRNSSSPTQEYPQFVGLESCFYLNAIPMKQLFLD